MQQYNRFSFLLLKSYVAHSNKRLLFVMSSTIDVVRLDIFRGYPSSNLKPPFVCVTLRMMLFNGYFECLSNFCFDKPMFIKLNLRMNDTKYNNMLIASAFIDN